MGHALVEVDIGAHTLDDSQGSGGVADSSATGTSSKGQGSKKGDKKGDQGQPARKGDKKGDQHAKTKKCNTCAVAKSVDDFHESQGMPHSMKQ